MALNSQTTRRQTMTIKASNLNKIATALSRCRDKLLREPGNDPQTWTLVMDVIEAQVMVECALKGLEVEVLNDTFFARHEARQ
jgi:hypothetical protein